MFKHFCLMSIATIHFLNASESVSTDMTDQGNAQAVHTHTQLPVELHEVVLQPIPVSQPVSLSTRIYVSPRRTRCAPCMKYVGAPLLLSMYSLYTTVVCLACTGCAIATPWLVPITTIVQPIPGGTRTITGPDLRIAVPVISVLVAAGVIHCAAGITSWAAFLRVRFDRSLWQRLSR